MHVNIMVKLANGQQGKENGEIRNGWIVTAAGISGPVMLCNQLFLRCTSMKIRLQIRISRLIHDYGVPS